MKYYLIALLLMLPGTAALAQNDEGEVIVISDLSRSEVSQFMEEAEDQFYAVFNANIDDEDFEITCRQEAPTGSNISVRMCEPQFMINARADNARNMQFNPGVVETDRAIRARLEPEYARLQEMMEQMTREVPEFAQIASILSQLRARHAELTN